MRDQLINFLQAAVAFLLLTNALSVAAAAYAIRTVHGLTHDESQVSAAERRVRAFLSAILPGSRP
jgi:hypothetical protein